MAYLQADVNAVTVPLVASTAKSVVGLKAPANQVVKILEARLSHDGAVSTNAPSVVDFARCTFATNAPGTNSTSTTPGKRDPGRQETVQTTAAYNWTIEPTVVTPQESTNVAQYNGLYHYIMPFASPLIVAGGGGFVVRANSPNNCNATSKITFEE